MIHVGDITKLSGWILPIVDVITGGSPCQDLSVAGKRAGLEGERSGLFMEQIRIIREMRERDKKENGRSNQFIRPRFAVWENVPGAFSSNGGRDFQAVLTEFARIAEPDAPDVPMPDNGKWPHSGCIYQKMGGWSIAWRVHDAQFWGVPQRRKRISLVADFGGLSAPEISFERKGMSGDSAESGTERKRTAAAFESGPAYSIQGNTVDRAAKQNGLGVSEDVAHTLNAVDRHAVCYPDKVSTLPARMDGSPCIDRGPPIVACLNSWDPQSARVYDANGIWHSLNANENGGQSRDAVFVYENHGQDSRVKELGDICESVSAKYGTGGNNTPLVLTAIPIEGNGVRPSHQGDGYGNDGDPSFTLNAVEKHADCIGNGQLNQISMSDKANTLDTMHDQQAVLIAYAPDTAHALHGKANLQFREDSETYIVAAVDCRNGRINPDTNGMLQAKEQGFNLNSNNVVLIWPEVRRLTPMECEKLQGYPDGWTDIGEWEDSKGKKHKDADSPRYKALGNSIALPFWFWLLRRISAQYERPATLGSLFDGIGGFPLCWERCNGPGTALWASEIEEFAIAVTKKHFPEDENDGKPVR